MPMGPVDMRAILTIVVLVLVVPSALGDVVILKENDVPLTGRIIGEDENTITFQVHGLGEGSRFHIDKGRVKRYWREENDFFEFMRNERERQGTLDRLVPAEAPPAPPPAPAAASADAPPTAPAPEVPAVRGRSAAEIRQMLLDKGWTRVRSALPGTTFSRLLAMLGSLALLGLLFRTGGRVAGIPKMQWSQAVLLSLFTHLLAFVAFAAPRTVLRPEHLPLLVSAEFLAWLAFVRILTGGILSRAVLLLSFCIASLALVGGSVFSVLTVL